MKGQFWIPQDCRIISKRMKAWVSHGDLILIKYFIDNFNHRQCNDSSNDSV